MWPGAMSERAWSSAHPDLETSEISFPVPVQTCYNKRVGFAQLAKICLPALFCRKLKCCAVEFLFLFLFEIKQDIEI